jgi:Ras-related GTP-binding protein A/B
VVQFFARKRRELEEASAPMPINCLPTSIWDETLYKAWSEIVYRLIPNIGHIESLLQKFCQIAGADEVVLFEVGLRPPSAICPFAHDVTVFTLLRV